MVTSFLNSSLSLIDCLFCKKLFGNNTHIYVKLTEVRWIGPHLNRFNPNLATLPIYIKLVKGQKSPFFVPVMCDYLKLRAQRVLWSQPKLGTLEKSSHFLILLKSITIGEVEIHKKNYKLQKYPI